MYENECWVLLSSLLFIRRGQKVTPCLDHDKKYVILVTWFVIKGDVNY